MLLVYIDNWSQLNCTASKQVFEAPPYKSPFPNTTISPPALLSLVTYVLLLLNSSPLCRCENKWWSVAKQASDCQNLRVIQPSNPTTSSFWIQTALPMSWDEKRHDLLIFVYRKLLLSRLSTKSPRLKIGHQQYCHSIDMKQYQDFEDPLSLIGS